MGSKTGAQKSPLQALFPFGIVATIAGVVKTGVLVTS
jgi:hypothetical protein